MKEEKGKILLLPSFIQQQQINKTNNKINNNNMTNKHEQWEKDGHQQWPDYQDQPLFKTSKEQQSRKKKKKKSNINIFNTPSNLKKK